MGRANKFILYLIVLLFFIVQPIIHISHAQKYITPEDAHKHIGENQTVCRIVASTFYSVRSNGQPTFLNLNKSYPNQIFTILIWGSNRAKFQEPPEVIYKNKNVCVSREIISYKGTPEIIITQPSQIQLKEQ